MYFQIKLPNQISIKSLNFKGNYSILPKSNIKSNNYL